MTMNRESLIYAAKQVALGMVESGWQTPAPVKVQVMGLDGMGNFRWILDSFRAGEFISEHDQYLSNKIGWVLSGGEVDIGAEVDEQYLLDLERKAFLEICRTRKSVERIEHMLKTGKPLRN